MSPTAKFNSLLAGATVFIMYFLVTLVAPLLQAAGVTFPLLLPVGAFVTSVGVYRLLTMALRWLMEKVEKIRELVLGPYYMNGTWVGWYRGHTGELRYMVEHFEQSLDSVVIRGWSYTKERQCHGDWVSDLAAIDAEQGTLHFTYKFNVYANSKPSYGLNESHFQRKSKRHAPYALTGLAHDLNDETRIPVQSQRVSNKLLSVKESLALAISIF